MLLSIDLDKVKKQLAETPLTFSVTSCNIEVHREDPQISQDAVHIFSTVTAVPPDLERARARLEALRQTVIESSGDDLDRAMDSLRGR